MPRALAYAQMVSIGDTLLIFGGVDGGWDEKVDTLWSINLSRTCAKWKVMTVPGEQPVARYYHSMTIAPPFVAVFGGEDSQEHAISSVHTLSLV